MVEDVSVAANVGVIPATPAFAISRRVIIMVEESTPSATTVPDPEIVEFAATGPELMLVNSTVPPVFTKGVAIESVLVSGVVDRRVQVEIPIRLLGLQAP